MEEKNQQRKIRAQKGFQEDFLSSPADIVVGGGAAGGGKTYALLLDPTRYFEEPKFGGVIFRRTTPQIRNEGGLWDTSMDIYSGIGGEPKESSLKWKLPWGSKMTFTHLEYDKDVLSHQGAQYPWIGFDELTHFTKKQFFYLLTRNRSAHGIKPCIRATCNPDPDSWVADFISWWIDQETGFPIPERNGVLRYFISDSGHLVWGDTVQEVIDKCPHIVNAPEFKDIKPKDLVKSVTFVHGDVYGNEALLRNNPEYLANLLSQDEELQNQLLKGNWKISNDDKALCNYLKINELFTNKLEKYERNDEGKIKLDEDKKKVLIKHPWYITCDAAREGANLAVIILWEGFTIKRIDIFTKSATTLQYETIEKVREESGNVPASHVLIDQDGVGGGIVDESGRTYKGFSGGGAVIQSREDKKKEFKENYMNLKAQVYYHMAKRINNNGVAIDPNVDIYVDGQKATQVKIGATFIDVMTLIKQDLRTFKKDKTEGEGKKRLNPKEEQKNMIGSRSPDCGDAIMLREWFELKPDVAFVFEVL